MVVVCCWRLPIKQVFYFTARITAKCLTGRSVSNHLFSNIGMCRDWKHYCIGLTVRPFLNQAFERIVGCHISVKTIPLIVSLGLLPVSWTPC